MRRNEQSREASLGKHAAKPRSRRAMRALQPKRHSALAAVAAIALVGVLAVGGTIAWLTAQTSEVKNTFIPASVTTTIVENNDGAVKQNVSIENTGNIPVYIRAKVIVSWVDKDNSQQISATVPVKGTDYTDWPKGSDWHYSAIDGCYYYMKAVEPADSTGVLIEELKRLESANVPDGYELSVEILSEAIQALPDNAFNESWGASSGLEANGGNLFKLSASASQGIEE